MRGAFVDTNIFVYSEDLRNPAKRVVAARLWRVLADEGAALVSSQVASELANTLIRLWSDPLATSVVVDSLIDSVIVLPVTPDIVRDAIRGVASHGFSFYDAQIWAAARVWGAPVVLTEDFTDGLTVEGVRFVDPFAEGFDIEALLGELAEA
ncbi:MAG: PIN domain-containing protein [Coriobacteriia bacterium]|nr:PIN domain-containing protein [Coriobacteriia bacterium]